MSCSSDFDKIQTISATFVGGDASSGQVEGARSPLSSCSSGSLASESDSPRRRRYRHLRRQRRLQQEMRQQRNSGDAFAWDDGRGDDFAGCEFLAEATEMEEAADSLFEAMRSG